MMPKILLILIFLTTSNITFTASSSLFTEKRYNEVFKANESFLKAKSKSSPNEDKSSVIEPPLFVGSFNIQTLGKKKFNNPVIMDIVQRIILRYDLILILEIHTDEDNYMYQLLRNVNLYLPPGEGYKMILSERQNQTKEHYALLYKTSKLKVITSESYEDPEVFYRKPLVAIFEAFTLRDMKKFGVIGQHVKPAKAVQEIDGLAGVYDYVKDTYEIEDVLIMGDFNADCTYVKENHWDNISLWFRGEFTWAITSKVDTTTNYRSCTLDRIVYAGENMNDGIILSTATAFDFQEAYDLNIYEARNVSDHRPVEVKIRSRMSDKAEKHLTAKICFQVRDTQPKPNITSIDIYSKANKAFFEVKETKNGFLLSNKTKEEEQMIVALKRLREKLPNIISHELEEAVKYKVKHGSLRDESSYADVYNSRYSIYVMSAIDYIEASICRITSIN